MKLFMILALPLSLIYALIKSDKAVAPYSSAAVGLFFGAVYSFTECMFTSGYYLMPYAFLPNYGFYLLFEVLLPCLFCVGVYFLFVKKRALALLSLYFMLAAFYAVYMPARIIHRNDVFDWYLLFVKPVLYTCMLLGIKHSASLCYETCRNYIFSQIAGGFVSKDARKRIVVSLLFMLAIIFIPPVVDVMHILNLSIWMVLSAALVYCTFSVFGKTILNRV